MLTLPQASEQTGKHKDTLRRLIKNLLKTDIEAKEKIKQEQTVRGFHYLIDEEYLLQHLQPLQTKTSKKSAKDKMASNQPMHQPMNNVAYQPLTNKHQPSYAEVKAKDETIAILKNQLEEKDEQIKTLLERSRETNILLKGYQDKYLLNAPGEQKVTKPIQADNDTPHKTPPNKQSTKTISNNKPHKFKPKKADKPKKKGFLSWF